MEMSKLRGRRLKQFFSYFGSKGSHAVRYPAPIHDLIIEPFAGSAGYACLYPEREVRLYDLSPTIAGLWKYLIRATKKDILSLPLDPDDTASLTQPERDLIGFWWARCLATPSKKPNAWMREGIYPYSFWGEQTRERIAGQVERIKHWTCDQKSFDQIRNVKATWFIDPPYQQQGQRYPYGAKQMDYKRLAEWVKERRGQVIACESDGADYLPFKPLFENSTIKYRKVKQTVTEVMYTHGDE